MTQPRFVLCVLAAAMALAALGQTIVVASLPAVVDDLSGFDRLCWIVASYLIGVAIAALLAGRLGERRSHRNVLLGGTAIFVLASAICALAQTMTGLICLRALQGFGAGAMMVSSQRVVADLQATPGPRGSRLLAVTFFAATIAGPAVGGALTELLGWRALFYMMIPAGILTVFLIAVLVVPSSSGRHDARPVDYAGPALLGISVVTLMLILSIAGISASWNSAVVIALGVSAVLARAALLSVERRAEVPALPLQLLRERQFPVALVFAFTVSAFLFGSLTFIPLLQVDAGGAEVVGVGAQMSAMLMVMVAASIAAGRYVDRSGHHRRPAAAGIAISVLALLLLSRVDLESGVAEETAWILLLGTGLGFAARVPLLIVRDTVSHELLGAAVSSILVFRTIGAAIGTGIFAFVFGNNYSPGGTSGTDSINANSYPNIFDTLASTPVTDALSTTFLLAAGLLAATAVLLLFMRDPQSSTRPTGALDSEAFPPPRDQPSSLPHSPGSRR